MLGKTYDIQCSLVVVSILISEPYGSAIRSRFSAVGGKMMPRHGIPWLREQFPDVEELPTDKLVKSFISQLRKCARESQAERDLPADILEP